MLKKSRRRQKAPSQAAAAPEPAAAPAKPTMEYAALGQEAPIAWPTAARRVPVTGQLSPHAAAALERMGITQQRRA